ncbi:reverse transcriptase domain-containing protein [Tanacetum coccineum]
MHTRASNSELVEPLPEPERTLNRRIRRRNRRVPFEQRNNLPQHPRVVYPPILDINYFCQFFDILRNYDPMDDESMWAVDRVVALTLGSTITIPETANEFAIKGNHLTLINGNQFDGRTKTDPHKHIHEFLEICDMFKYKDTNDPHKHIIRVVRINVPLVDVLAGMPNYGKFLKELVNNKHKIEQISATFLSNESSSILQNNVPPKLGYPGSFLIPCNFNKSFSCNVLADIGASINLTPYSLYAKLSLETLKPTKMSVRLVDRSFQYPVGIAENMLVKVGKFTFLADFVILEMEEDSKVPLILGRPFLHTADAVIRVKQKKLNLGVRTERMIFHIDSVIKHSYSNDDTCFSIDVIDEILEEDFDALLDEGSEMLHSIKGTILEEKCFAEFDEFMAMTADVNSKYESDTEEPPFEKITFNTD